MLSTLHLLHRNHAHAPRRAARLFHASTRALVCTAGLLVALALRPPAALAEDCTDVEGAKDHPLVSRYAGSCLVGYDAREFDEFTLPLGKIIRDKSNNFVPEQSQRLEGKVTRLVYASPAGRSTLEVLRNYEQSLAASGYETLFGCAGADCGATQMGSHFLYSLDRRLENHKLTAYAIRANKDQRYLAMKSKGADGDVYVSLYVTKSSFSMFTKEFGDGPVVLLDVIEMKAMDTDMVSAAAMAKGLESEGRVSIYGLYFDTGKATIKAESEPTLAEMAKLLIDNAGFQVYVVGHTDNEGRLESNMDLSRQRAQAVVTALATRHSIEESRLVAQGVGPLAPVASNRTDGGRADNRRVELVLR